MADFVDELETAYGGAIREKMFDVMVEANDVMIDGAFRGDEATDVIRVDKGENLQAAVAGWAPGHDGGSFSPVEGQSDYSIPGNDAARQAADTYILGEGTSTTIKTNHAFWADEDHDATFETVAEALT